MFLISNIIFSGTFIFIEDIGLNITFNDIFNGKQRNPFVDSGMLVYLKQSFLFHFKVHNNSNDNIYMAPFIVSWKSYRWIT